MALCRARKPPKLLNQARTFYCILPTVFCSHSFVYVWPIRFIQVSCTIINAYTISHQSWASCATGKNGPAGATRKAIQVLLDAYGKGRCPNVGTHIDLHIVGRYR